MSGHKRIERCIADYIIGNYRNVAEVGVGGNPDAALLIRDAGIPVFCTDSRNLPPVPGLTIIQDDIFSPVISLYQGIDLIYSIRPHEEMIPSLIHLATQVDCDLLVYHLGFECCGDGGELVECGVVLHCYYRRQNPSKSVF